METSATESYGTDGDLELPPGFRFHPTDEELIACYLSPKTLDASFSPNAVGVVDLNKCEPWNLPTSELAKTGTCEWYFFSVRDKKYPNGLRTNRATDAGYWKATGKDKEVYKGTSIVGFKKTLVFYIGRAPKGEKSNWIMHEYRLCPSILPSLSKSEWVICRVYHKSSIGRSFPLLSGSSRYTNQSEIIPQTMMNPQEAAQYDNNQTIDVIQKTPIAPTYHTQGYYPVVNEGPNPVYPYEINPFKGNSQYPYGVYPEQPEMYLGGPILEDNNGGGGLELQQQQGIIDFDRGMGFDVSMSHETFMSNDPLDIEFSSVVSNDGVDGDQLADQGDASTSYGPGNIDSFWKY